MERNPERVFYEKKLVARFPEDATEAMRDRLLVKVPLQLREGVVSSYSYGLSRTHTVVYENGRLEAFDDADSEADPIPLRIEDLTQWMLDLKAFALKVQAANGLSGETESLSGRLFFLGEADEGDERSAYVLGLLGTPAIADLELAGLPQRLPGRYSRIIVLCPRFDPSPSFRRKLESRRVYIIPLRFTHAPGQPAFGLHLAVPTVFPPSDSFQPSKDCRFVRWKDETLNLSEAQAQVVGALHSAWRTGRAGLSWEAIKSRTGTKARYMSDIFRKSDPRAALIVRDKNSQIYRLNL